MRQSLLLNGFAKCWRTIFVLPHCRGVLSASHPIVKYSWQNTHAHSASRGTSHASISQKATGIALPFLFQTIPYVNCFRSLYLQGDLQPTGCPREPRQILRGRSSGLKKYAARRGAPSTRERMREIEERVRNPAHHQGHTGL